MRYAIVIAILALLPILVMGTVFDGFQAGKFLQSGPGSKDLRTWRLNEVQEELYNMGWEQGGKYFFIYDDEHPTRLDTLKYCYWFEDQQAWIPVVIEAYEYDSSNEYVTHAMQTMNFGGQLIPFTQSQYQYDNQHRLTLGLISYFDGEQNQWFPGFRIQIIYNNNADYAVYNWQAGDSENPQRWLRQSFIWDAQGRITTETQQSSLDSLTWTNSTRSTYTYDPNDTTTGDIFVDNVAHYVPMQSLYDMLGYEDFLGMTTDELYEEWDGSAWVNSEHTVRTYTDADNLADEHGYNWSGTAWAENFLFVYTYDTSYNISQKTENYWQDTAMVPDTRYTYNWGQVSAGDDDVTPPVSGLALSVYPNPFAGSAVIRIVSKENSPAELAVYNTRGQLVRKLAAETNSSISWDGCDAQGNLSPSGVYFLKASVGNRETAAKLLRIK